MGIIPIWLADHNSICGCYCAGFWLVLGHWRDGQISMAARVYSGQRARQIYGDKQHFYNVDGLCDRALGTPGDEKVVPLLLDRLEMEADEGLQVAYATALGQMGVVAATQRLLTLLSACEERSAQQELALAVARLVGSEHRFIQLWRQVNGDMGTAVAQELLNLKKKLNGETAELDT